MDKSKLPKGPFVDNRSIRDTDFYPSRSWKARWIWSAEKGRERNVYYLFRREFHIEASPKQAMARISADTRYRLYINGALIGDGPILSQPHLTYYDELQITSHLEKGTNAIAVAAYHLGTVPDTRGGLLAEMELDGKIEVGTDGSWRVMKAAAWAQNTFASLGNVASPYQEVFDSRLEPHGWLRAGFDDTGWDAATEISTGRGIVSRENRISEPPAVMPWSRIIPRDIPPMDLHIVEPKAITSVEECLALDHRVPTINLAVGLSAVGTGIRYSSLENPEALLEKGESYATAKSSTDHLDHRFDGVYDPCIVYDFGRIITAYIEIEMEGPEGGMVDIGYVERLIDGHFNNTLECQFADRFVLRGGRQTFRSYAWRGFRYVKIRFRECYSEVRATALRAVTTTYPYEERGSFICDVEDVNRIWRMSRYTLRLCSHEFFMDTPWREQGQWLGDVAAVTLGGVYACFGDTTAAAKFLRQSASNQLFTGFIANKTNTLSHDWTNGIVDYSLFWIQALWDHYMYTGDLGLLQRLYPTVLKILFALTDYVDEYGLLSNVPYWTFIDWAHIDRGGECAALNALYYEALMTSSKMAKLKNDDYVQRLAEELTAKLKRNFASRFFDAGKRCFVDANREGELSDLVSEHANMLAVQYGICDHETAARIIDVLYVSRTVPYTRAEPYFTWQVLKGLDRADAFDLALDIMQDRWGMMLSRGASSCSEEWGINGTWRAGASYGTWQRTESHAWSACPAEFLTKTLIGLEITEPGCRKVRISPRRPTRLPNYEVRYPTPLGLIHVERKEDQLSVKLPEGMARS